jgi:hypothetical protein
VTLRLVSALLLALAGALYLGVAAPALDRVAGQQQEQRRLRAAQQEASRRVAMAKEQLAARQRVATILAEVGPAASGSLLAALRADVLTTLRQWSVSEVTLHVRPLQRPEGAAFRLSAKGPYRDVVGLTRGLARPRLGVILQRVSFRAGEASVALEIEGQRVRILP